MSTRHSVRSTQSALELKAVSARERIQCLSAQLVVERQCNSLSTPIEFRFPEHGASEPVHSRFELLVRAGFAGVAETGIPEKVCCLLVLDSVTSTPQWIRQPKPRDVLLESLLESP